MLITSYFTWWQGSAELWLWCVAHTSAPNHYWPLSPSSPLSTMDTRGEDSTEPASSSPRGFELPCARPAWDPSSRGHLKPLYPSYVSPSPCCFPCFTGPGAQEDEIFHWLLNQAGFPCLALSVPIRVWVFLSAWYNLGLSVPR